MVRYGYPNGECFVVIKILVLLHICMLRLISIFNNFFAEDTLSVTETGLLGGLVFWGCYP